ncbi:MAG: hypothetical protein ACTSPD_21765, partial [Promethearchaeota archaeon]
MKDLKKERKIPLSKYLKKIDKVKQKHIERRKSTLINSDSCKFLNLRFTNIKLSTVIQQAAKSNGDKDKFYFGVDDDDRSFKIRGRIYLNFLDGLFGDLSAKVLSKPFKYDPKSVGNTETVKKENENGNMLKLKFKTLGIPRVNTIAVYENGT